MSSPDKGREIHKKMQMKTVATGMDASRHLSIVELKNAVLLQLAHQSYVCLQLALVWIGKHEHTNSSEEVNCEFYLRALFVAGLQSDKRRQLFHLFVAGGAFHGTREIGHEHH